MCIRDRPEPGRAITADALEDPLLASCRMVGRALGLAIKSYPRTHDADPPRDPLAGILHASRLRSTRVGPRGGWLLEASGPLLASRGPGRQPVRRAKRQQGAAVLGPPA